MQGNGMKARDRIAQITGKRDPARAELGRLREERKAEGLAARLAHGRNLRRRITWPGTAVELDLAVLTQRQRSEAMAEAIVELRKRGIDDGKPAPEHLEPAAVEHVVQILARAIRDPDTGAQVFASGTELADAATEDEVGLLFTAYSEFRQEVDPDAEELPAAEWDEFLLAVKKKELDLSNAIASAWRRSWLLSSVGRLASSLTESSWNTPFDGESPPTTPEEGEPT